MASHAKSTDFLLEKLADSSVESRIEMLNFLETMIMFMAFPEIGVIFAVIAVAFSIIWVVFGYKGLRLGSKYLRIRERNGSSRAVEILKERYARGEITKEQFESMMRELE
jgi:uncharacterized membrane protein